MSLRIRRGLSTDIPTPLEGELLYTTDNGNLYVGFYDQAQDAVIPKLTSASLVDDSNPTLSANLDLGGNNIVGTGNINIDGTITATGNINLGDGAEDNVIVGGVISSSLIPNSDGVYTLGTSSNKWNNGFFDGLEVSGELIVDSLKIDRIINDSSSVLYDAAADTLSVENIRVDILTRSDSSILYDSTLDLLTVETVEGDLSGSVIADDDSVMINALDKSINSSLLKINADGDNLAEDIFGLALEDGSTTAGIEFLTSRNSIESPEIVDFDDFVFVIGGKGYNSSDYVFSSAIGAFVDDTPTPGSNSIAGKLIFSTCDGTRNIFDDDFSMSLSSDGTVSTRQVDIGRYLKFPVFATSTERDNELTVPEKGMVAVLDDTGTGSAGIQYYNGTGWITL